jgi:hypothetical protein
VVTEAVGGGSSMVIDVFEWVDRACCIFDEASLSVGCMDLG